MALASLSVLSSKSAHLVHAGTHVRISFLCNCQVVVPCEDRLRLFIHAGEGCHTYPRNKVLGGFSPVSFSCLFYQRQSWLGHMAPQSISSCGSWVLRKVCLAHHPGGQRSTPDAASARGRITARQKDGKRSRSRRVLKGPCMGWLHFPTTHSHENSLFIQREQRQSAGDTHNDLTTSHCVHCLLTWPHSGPSCQHTELRETHSSSRPQTG